MWSRSINNGPKMMGETVVKRNEKYRYLGSINTEEGKTHSPSESCASMTRNTGYKMAVHELTKLKYT
jgi:hypothetical protein